MSQKILVTKENADVLTPTNLDDFLMHSDYPLLKKVAEGSFSGFSVSSFSSPSETITHSLGYRPYVFVWTQKNSSEFMNPSADVVTDEFFLHDWFTSGATYSKFGRTWIFDDKLEIYVGSTYTTGKSFDGYYVMYYDEV